MPFACVFHCLSTAFVAKTLPFRVRFHTEFAEMSSKRKAFLSRAKRGSFSGDLDLVPVEIQVCVCRAVPP